MEADPWTHLLRYTSARVALGRCGGSLPTARVLEFNLAHARARDAVHAPFDAGALQTQIEALGLKTFCVQSNARDLHEYLLRPDLGRLLNSKSREELRKIACETPPDCVLVVADGLSAAAVHAQTIPLLKPLLAELQTSKISLAPIMVVRHGRVAIEDEIGELLGARCACILIGERPGLGSPDSLGAYTVFDPKQGRTDAERNCVSNIRPQGIVHEHAAQTIAWLIRESLRRRISGVLLKDERLLTESPKHRFQPLPQEPAK